jgi:hypothetical protein
MNRRLGPQRLRGNNFPFNRRLRASNSWRRALHLLHLRLDGRRRVTVQPLLGGQTRSTRRLPLGSRCHSPWESGSSVGGLDVPVPIHLLAVQLVGRMVRVCPGGLLNELLPGRADALRGERGDAGGIVRPKGLCMVVGMRPREGLTKRLDDEG